PAAGRADCPARAARPALLRALPRRRLPVPATRRLDLVRDGRVPRLHCRARAVDDTERPTGAARDLARVPAPERRPALGQRAALAAPDLALSARAAAVLLRPGRDVRRGGGELGLVDLGRELLKFRERRRIWCAA